MYVIKYIYMSTVFEYNFEELCRLNAASQQKHHISSLFSRKSD